MNNLIDNVFTVTVKCPHCEEVYYVPATQNENGVTELSLMLCPYCYELIDETNIVTTVLHSEVSGARKFNILDISNKLDICGMPIRADTYRTCSFGCSYCFANSRTIFNGSNIEFGIGNIQQLKTLLNRVFEQGIVNEDSLFEKMLSQRYSIHCGGMADPFQPAEEEYQITKQFIDECNKYGLHIVFSTKSNTVYGADIRPDLHSFQLSISNVDNRTDFEPNVPDIESRYKFFRELKDKGFKVAIRIQPFIPNVSTLKIVEKFKDADHFILEGIKIVPTNEEHKQEMFEKLNLGPEHFTCLGLLNLRPSIRFELYKPFIQYFQKNNISYSISDNDLRWLGNNKCCCGDCIVEKATTFNTTSLIKKYGMDWTKENVLEELEKSGVSDNKVSRYNRQIKFKEMYDNKFDCAKSVLSPKFQRNPKKLKEIFEYDKKIINRAKKQREAGVDISANNKDNIGDTL